MMNQHKPGDRYVPPPNLPRGEGEAVVAAGDVTVPSPRWGGLAAPQVAHPMPKGRGQDRSQLLL